MKRTPIMVIAAAAASAITLSAAGCGGGSYSSQPYGSPVAPTDIAATGVGVANTPLGRGDAASPAGRKIDSDD
jgi:hypothetical protein